MRAKNVRGMDCSKVAGRDSRRLSAMRLVALALCFVAVFALTLAFGFSNIGDNVAHANELRNDQIPNWSKGTEATYGTLTAISGDQGDFTANTIGFPGTTNGKTSWTQNVTFANHVPTLDNTQFYKTDADSFIIRVNENNKWEFKLDATNKEHNLAWGLVYKVPESIIRLVNSRLFNVTATIRFDAVKYLRNYGPSLVAKEVSGEDISGLSAKDIIDIPNKTTMPERGDNEITQTPSLTLRLTGQTHIFLGIWARMYIHVLSEKYVYAEGLHIDFNINMVVSPTFTSGSYYYDGGAPVWGNDFNYVNGKQDFSFPYREGNGDGSPKQDDNWPVFDSAQLGGTDNRYYPADSKDNFISYQGQPINVDGASSISHAYYKYTQLTAIDSYCYMGAQDFNESTLFSSDISTAEKRNTMGLYHRFIGTSGNIKSSSDLSWTTSSQAYASGLKSVEVTVIDSKTAAENSKTIEVFWANMQTDHDLTVAGKTLAHLKITKVERGGFSGTFAGAIKLEIYAYANCEIEFIVKDFGDLELRRTLTYGGIDTSAPDNDKFTFTDEDEEGYFTKDANDGEWYHNESMNIQLAITEELVAPNFYFIAVKKTNDVIAKETDVSWATFAHKDDWKVLSLLTADIEDALLAFNFRTGQFTYRGSPIEAYNDDGAETKGSGKYLFRVYTFDMAGNAASETADYYINVDYDKPNFEAVLTYGEEGRISAAEKGKWITDGNAKLTITPKLAEEAFFNTSGNTLTFENGSSTMFVSAATKDAISATNGTLEDGKAVVEVRDSIDKVIKLNISITDGIFEITFEDADGNSSPDMTLNMEFTLLVGAYENINNIDVDGASGDWEDGVDVLIDAHAPILSSFEPQYRGERAVAVKEMDVNEDAVGVFSADIESLLSISAGQREWFGATSLGAQLMLFDDMLNSDEYAEAYSIRLGVKGFRNNEELQAFIARDFLQHFNSDFDANNALEWFDKYLALKGTAVNNGMLNIPETGTGTIDLRYNNSPDTAGLRLLFLWAVDQAGNCSAPKVCYVFSDSATYNLTAGVYSSDILGKDTATFSIENGAGIKRGDEVTLKLYTADGYVPYRLAFGGESGDVMLENLGADVKGLEAQGAYEALLSGYGNVQDGNIEVKFTFDTADFDDISVDERALSFKHRLVVDANFGDSNRVFYKAASGKEAEAVSPLDLTVVIRNLTDELADKAKAAFRLQYVVSEEENEFPLYAKKDSPREYTTSQDEAATLADGSPIPFAAINVGTYSAYIFIPTYDEAFVASDVTFEGGEQVLQNKIEIVIDPLTLYVVAEEGEAEYGREITLTSKLSLSENGEEYTLNANEGTLKGSLKLDIAEGVKAAAGRHPIVQDTPFEIEGKYKDNFALAFAEGKQFTVSQRKVSIAIFAASKAFGDSDPIFKFGVDKAQFEGEDADAILAEIFDGYEAAEAPAGFDNYAAYASFAFVRGVGEQVGEYEFGDDLSRVVVNSNYALVLDKEKTQKFNITKREVAIAVTGSTLLPYSSQAEGARSVAPDIGFEESMAKFGYRLLNAADMTKLVTNEIDGLLSGLFKLDGEPVQVDTQANYSLIEYYNVILAEYDSKNVTLTLSQEDENNRYYVYVAEASVVAIEVKEGVAVNTVFGEKWDGATVYPYAEHKGDFDVTIDGVDANSTFQSIVWSITIEGHKDGDYLPVGSYVASISASSSSGGEETEYKYAVGNIIVNVAPAEIVIRPKFEATSRAYGDSDDAYGIGFEIVSVNGQPLGDEGYANIAKTDLEQLVSNNYGKAFAFARAVFSADGTRFASADVRDGATTGDTHVNADGRYYAAEFVGTPRLDGENGESFTLSAQTVETRLDVTPKPLEIDIAKFAGICKDYDGTTVAFYSGNALLDALSDMPTKLAYDLRSALLFGDEVQLGFDANYSNAGDPETLATYCAITFSKFALIGEKAGNYAIGKIVNSATNGAKAFGEEAGNDYSRELNAGDLESLTIEIIHIDNASQNDDDTNKICVRAGAIGVWYSDLALSKVYDGRTDLASGELVISDRLAADGTSNASPYLLKQAKLSLPSEVDGVKVNLLADANHGEEKFVTLALFFTFENVDVNKLTIANQNAAYPEYSSADVTVRVDTIGEEQGILVLIPNFAVSVEKRVIGGDSFRTLTYKSRAYNGLDAVEADEMTFAEGAIVESDAQTLGLTLIGSITGGDKAGNVGVGEHTVSFVNDIAYSGVTNDNYLLDIDSLNEAYAGENAIKVNVTPAQLVPNLLFASREYNALTLVDEAGYTRGTTDFKTLQFYEQLAGELEHLKLTGEFTVDLSKDGKPDANVYADANGGYLHSVLFSAFTLTAEEGIDLANYELVGFNDADGRAQTLTSGIEVQNYEMAEAIELVKAVIRIIDNDVKVRDKIYDDSFAATIDVAVPQTVPESDREFLAILAEGKFQRKAVGNDIPVVFAEGGATLVVSDPEKQYLIGNYEVSATDTTFSGRILARPVSVDVSLGVKTYDGSASINTDNVTYSFDTSTMIARDNGKYNVQTAGGAFFDDANVALGSDGAVVQKRGNVYDPTLRDKTSTTETLSNYRLVAKASEAREGVTPYAVLLANGTIITGAEYESRMAAADVAFVAQDAEAGGQTSELEIVAYFYDLPSTSRAISASDAKQAASEAGEHFIGYIEKNGVGYALVDEAYEGDVTTFDAPITYIAAMGTIERQTLSIVNGAAVAKSGTKAFSKEYDGTVKFFGKIGADFTFDAKKLAGIRGNDDVYLTDIVGEFDKADSTATVVIFSGTLAGEAKDNYVLSGNATATVRASITKRAITATLADGTMTYGTLPGSVVGDISYSMGGYPVTAVDRTFFMKLFDFLKATGFVTDEQMTVAPADKAYVEAMTAGSLFNLQAGEFTPFEGEPNEETYIKLSGEFLGLPRAMATFRGAANAGATASSYVLTGGEATNFRFAFAYTNGRTSTLTVVRKDVYVSATSNSHTVTYGGKIPTESIAYYDEAGAPYFIRENLFIAGGVNFGPQFGWYLFDTRDPSGQRLETHPRVLPADLSGEEQMYVGKYYMPAGVDYAAGTAPGGLRFDDEIKNYNFHFGTIVSQTIEGQHHYYVTYGDDSPYNASTATLVVTQPEITGLTAMGETQFVYDGEGSSGSARGTNKLLSMISGLTSSDAVSFKGTREADWLSGRENVNNVASVYLPGTYSGAITVTRTFKWDDGDSGIQVSATFNDIRFTVTPKVPTMYARDNSMRFDGNVHAYDCTNNVSGDMQLQAGDVILAYEKLVGSAYYPAYTVDANGQQIPVLRDGEGYYSLDARGNRTNYADADVKLYAQTDENGNVIGILDVGAYRVSITPTDRYIQVMGHRYEKVTLHAYVTITARPVEVSGLKVDGVSSSGTDAQGAAVFSMMFDAAKTYASSVDYDVQTLSDSGENLNPSALIVKANTKLIGLENVTGPGRYSFSVVIANSAFDPSNYSFVLAKGVLELKTNSFLSESGKGLTADDSLTLAEDGIVANRLTVRQIKGKGGSGSDLDLWKRLETYMPSIGESAKLAGVVQVRLYLGSTRVYATGKTMELAISIPEGVDSELNDVVVYVRSENGGLVRLDDYRIEGGKLHLVTSYLGEIVFVDISTSQLPAWAIWTIVAVCAAVGVFVAWVVVAFVIRRSKLKKLV